MSANHRLKKILTWTIMSLVGITVAPAEIMGGDLPHYAYRVDAAYLAAKKSQKRQLDCLARNVYYEAGSEPFKGQLAVAQVTVNRAHSSKFPNDICKVISQSKTVGEQRICQFSWYCDSTKNKFLKISEAHPSYIAAKKVFLEGHRLSTIGSNTYFFHNLTVKISESYPYRVIAKIGNHIFYRREK